MSREFVVMPAALRPQEAKLQATRGPGATGQSGRISQANAQLAASVSLMKKSQQPPPRKQTSPLKLRPAARPAPDVMLPEVALATLASRDPIDVGLRSSPAVVHFAGFVPGKNLRAHISILNIAKDPQRVYVHPISPNEDDGEAFIVEKVNAGRLAPGISQDVIVTFSPRESRYYYAKLRVVGETGELVIPLHGYPVSTTLDFPTRVDFGKCALAQPVTRVVSLSPGVPIPFEVELLCLTQHADFQVYPTRAVIPPNGTLDVTVTYTPTSLSTAVAEYQLRTSHAVVEPRKVVLSGSAAPSMARDKRLLEALAESERLEARGAAALAPDATAPRPRGISSAELPQGPLGDDEAAEGPAAGGDDGAYGSSEPLDGHAGYGPGGHDTTRPDVNRGTGQLRWLSTDPGLAVVDDRLAAFKARSESKLIEALEERSAIVDNMAESLRLATGVRVTRDQALDAVQGVLRGMGKEKGAVNDYGRVAYPGQSEEKVPTKGVGGTLRAIAESTLYRDVAGTRLPPTIPVGAQKELNYVLEQRPGATAPRDLKFKIAEARQAREATRAAQERLRSLAAGVAAGEDVGQPDLPGPGMGQVEQLDDDDEYEGGELEHKSMREGSMARSRSISPGRRGPGLGDTARSFSMERAQAHRRQAVLKGPGLSTTAMAAAELSGSWLFPALQGVPAQELLPILVGLVGTPDHVTINSGTLLDELLGGARAQLLDSTAARQLPHVKHIGDGLPPVLAALVRAAAAPLRRPRELREDVFSAEVAELASAQRAREQANYPWLGEQLLTVGEVKRLKRLRVLLRALEDAVRRRLNRTRRTTVAVPAGGLRAVYESLNAAAQAGQEGHAEAVSEGNLGKTLLVATAVRTGAPARAHAIKAAGSDPAEQFPILSSPVVKAALLPVSGPLIEAGARAAVAPTFRDEQGKRDDGWAVKRDAVTRLRDAVSAGVARRRVEKRLVALERKLEGAAMRVGGVRGSDLAATRALVATLVEQEFRRAGLEDVESWVLTQPPKLDPKAPPEVREMQEAEIMAGPKLKLQISADRITRVVLPVAPPEESADVGKTDVRGWDLRVPLATDIPTWFCEDAAFAVPEGEWPEEHIMGYTPLPLPVAPTYQPREDARPLREGALHETAATGFLPLPSAQSQLDPRLAEALQSARTITIPGHGLGVLAEAGTRLGWDVLGEGHPSVRHAPAGVAAHPATGLRLGAPSEAEPGHGLAAGSWLRVPHLSTPADPTPAVLGHRQPYTYGHGIGAAPPAPGLPPGLLPPALQGAQGIHGPGTGAGVAGDDGEGQVSVALGPRNMVLSGPAAAALGASYSGCPLDANGVLPTQGQVMGGVTGLSSLRHATAALPRTGAAGSSGPASPSRVGAAIPPSVAGAGSASLPARWSHRYSGTTSRPPLDMAAPLLGEVAQPKLKADGTPRLPTDVTPTEKRQLFALHTRPGADPWLPSSLPALLPGPDPADALSDDSESDGEREERARLTSDREAKEEDGRSSPRSVGFASGGGDSPSRGGRLLPKRAGPAPPSLDQARDLFLPKAMRAGTDKGKAGPADVRDSSARLRLEAVEPAGSHVASTHAVKAGKGSADAPLVPARDRAQLHGAAFDLAGAWQASHWLEGVLVGLPPSDAGDASSHPPRLGHGSGPGLGGVHVHDQAPQGAHVRRPRGTANIPAAPGTVGAGVTEDRRHMVMRPE